MTYDRENAIIYNVFLGIGIMLLIGAIVALIMAGFLAPEEAPLPRQFDASTIRLPFQPSCRAMSPAWVTT